MWNFNRWPDMRPGSGSACLFALGCVILATLIRLALDPIVPPGSVPFITYFPALLFVTLLAGLWAGALALAASIFLAWWLFIPPVRSFYLAASGREAVTLAIFVASGALVVWAAERHRRMVELLKEEEHHRKVVVEELNHRVKNKLATVYALLGRELRKNPEIWRKVQGRLKALTATDDFIARSGGDSMAVRDILMMELTPYEGSRLRIDVDEVLVPAKPATLLALIFHELVTNAAKYGALSTDTGEVAILCRKMGNKVQLDWAESGGPAVQPPQQRGLGTTLLEGGLGPYQGVTELRFDPTGFSCKILFMLPSLAPDNQVTEAAGPNFGRLENQAEPS